VERNSRDFWWLVGLEATLFLSLPCWEMTAPWAKPTSHPAEFGIALVGAATVATLACHVGPGLLAKQFGRPQHWIWALLLVWLGIGYAEWAISVARAVADAMPTILRTSMRIHGNWIHLCSLLIASAAVGVLGFVKSWWKPASLIGLILGGGVLVWALSTTWHGLWVRNPHYTEDPLQFEWIIVQGILLSAGPTVAIAWLIGDAKSTSTRQIWLSGFAGVWLPVILSVTVASLAAEAGANLHWVPSLLRGFNWALLGAQGRAEPVVLILAFLTFLSPALVSVEAIRQLAPSWVVRSKVALLVTAACLVVVGTASDFWHFEGPYLSFSTPLHEFWAASLVVLGAVAGIICIVRRAPRA